MIAEAADRNFLVVGSGAAGLTAAVTAAAAGLRPIVIEKESVWGGTTALAGGVIWAPSSHLMERDGEPDSAEDARRYVDQLMDGLATPRRTAKVERFLEASPKTWAFLEEQGVRWVRNAEHPDYYPDIAGARVGRTIESDMIDGKRTGAMNGRLGGAAKWAPPMYTGQMSNFTLAKTGIRPFWGAAKVLARYAWWRVRGRDPLTRGKALLTSLMEILIRADVPVLLDTKLVELVRDGDRVTGAIVERGGQRSQISAPAGVLLAAGGFAHNPALRRQYHAPMDGGWSNAAKGDQGDGLLAGMQVGAATELTEDAWWQPSILIAPGTPSLTLGERALPGSIVVNEHGKRYMNEAYSYHKAGQTMIDNGAHKAAHWLIFGQKFIDRFVFRVLSDPALRKSMKQHGYWRTANSIEDLAKACDLDPRALADTVARFNGFARAGKDEDFGRGESNYAQYWADPKTRPNRSLAPIEHGPFHAVRIVPGDIGTNGGIMTDEDSRALDEQERPIPGLYAAGNNSGSPFGKSYPGGGATIGAATVFGYLAASHAARAYNHG